MEQRFALSCSMKADRRMSPCRTNHFVLTGGFGSGKSTLLERLRSRGIRGIAEPARQILAEQRSIQGNGVPDKDPRLFVELMLSRMLSAYRRSERSVGPVVFDRGIPDLLGYAELFGFPFPPGERAAEICRYNRLVFIAPGWEQIYRTDDERTVPFPVARDFGNSICRIYERLGYTLPSAARTWPAGLDMPGLHIREPPW